MFHVFLDILLTNSTLDELRMYKKLCRYVPKLEHLLLIQALLSASYVTLQMSVFLRNFCGLTIPRGEVLQAA